LKINTRAVRKVDEKLNAEQRIRGKDGMLLRVTEAAWAASAAPVP
jgi:ribosomal protein S3AE